MHILSHIIGVRSISLCNHWDGSNKGSFTNTFLYITFFRWYCSLTSMTCRTNVTWSVHCEQLVVRIKVLPHIFVAFNDVYETLSSNLAFAIITSVNRCSASYHFIMIVNDKFRKLHPQYIVSWETNITSNTIRRMIETWNVGCGTQLH